MPTFTKLKKTQDFYDEVVAKTTELGAWQDGVNSDAWTKFALDIILRIETEFKIYEQESTAYFSWLDPKLAKCKQLAADSLTLVSALGKGWSDATYKLLEATKVDLETVLGEISTTRAAMANHQGFRGNLGFDAKSGAAPRLEKYEAIFKAKRKVFIDKNEATVIKIDKAKAEYRARIDNAIALAKKYQAQSGRQIVIASDELTAIKKDVLEWQNLQSAKYTEINKAIKKVEDFLTDVTAKPKSASKQSFISVRTNFPVIKKNVDAAKANLNTDVKRFAAVKGGLGNQIYDKKLLDQKLVKDVEGGLEKLKESIKKMGDTIVKDLEAKISKVEKKLLG